MTGKELIAAINAGMPIDNEITFKIDQIYSETSEGLKISIMDADNDEEVAHIKAWVS